MPTAQTASKEKSSSLRERNKQRIHQRLHETAITLLSRTELEQITIEDICEGAEISKKTFYNYYPSKHDLIEAISQSLLLDASRRHFDECMSRFSTTRERLLCFLQKQGSNLSDKPLLERNLIRHAMLDLSQSSDSSGKKMENQMQLFEKMLEAGKQRGEINPAFSPRFLAEMIDGAINTSAIHWIHFPDYPVNKRYRELKQFILDIALTPP